MQVFFKNIFFEILRGVLERSIAFLCGFEKGLIMLMNLFDQESI